MTPRPTPARLAEIRALHVNGCPKGVGFAAHGATLELLAEIDELTADVAMANRQKANAVRMAAEEIAKLNAAINALAAETADLCACGHPRHEGRCGKPRYVGKHVLSCLCGTR